MSGRDDLDRAAALPLGAMAAALGADLGAAERGERRAMADRCDGCAFPELCAVWLMDEPAPVAAPDYCPNRDMLATLCGMTP